MGQRTSRINDNIFGIVNITRRCDHRCQYCGANAANGTIAERRPRSFDALGDHATQGGDESPMGLAVEERIEVGPPSYEETICSANCKIVEIQEPQEDNIHLTSKVTFFLSGD